MNVAAARKIVQANFEAFNHLKKLRVNDDVYSEIQKMMRSTIQHTQHDEFHYSDYNIRQICAIKNSLLEKRHSIYKKLILMQMKHDHEPEEMILYHGTPFAHKIAYEGFKVKCSADNNKFGKGIYFASHSSKSNQYAWGNHNGCPAHDETSCPSCIRRMLICKCFLGNQYHADEQTDVIPPGYHSVVVKPERVPSIYYPEFAIRYGEQVMPMYLVEYTIVP